MTADKKYCMSSFLMFRTIADIEKCFADGTVPKRYIQEHGRDMIYTSRELEEHLMLDVEKACMGKKAALALSGGIDSAILAKFMPKGSVAYTFKCIVPGIKVTDETSAAACYARECGLEHRVVEIYWEDFEKYAPLLMKAKGTPIHSIEVQIYKAALRAKSEGFDTLIFGESADANYGGLNGLLSRDWSVDQFIERFSNVLPNKVLKDPMIIKEPFEIYAVGGKVQVHEFIRHVFFHESMGSYTNASECAGIGFLAPYANTYMAVPLNLDRVRAGENKYLVREIFNRLYPGFSVPPKTPMPRPMNEWMADWQGPVRSEFWPHCTDSMTGDQKWLVYILEKFLNMIDDGNI